MDWLLSSNMTEDAVELCTAWKETFPASISQYKVVVDNVVAKSSVTQAYWLPYTVSVFLGH